MSQFFLDLWEMAKQGGPFAGVMLLVVLYFVNEERKECLKENRALYQKNELLVERIFRGLEDVNATLKDLQNIFLNARGRR